MARADSIETAGTKRPRKSKAEKAQADYDAAVKTRDLAAKKLAKLQEGVAPAQEAYEASERRVAYLGQNPDLPSGVGQEPSDV
jgi:hypothetical protein